MRFEELSTGDELTRTVTDLRGEDMKLIAALLEDPYPPHYDRRRADDLDYPGLLNQGPANLSYMLQPIIAELDVPSNVERFDTRFHEMVFEAETVTATATIREKDPDANTIEFAVDLTKEDGTVAVDGTVTATFSDR
ncbi:MaoC family dehydratase [Haladaptatus sp. NG-SE-30]